MTVRPRIWARLACAFCSGLLVAISSSNAFAYGWITYQGFLANERLNSFLGRNPRIEENEISLLEAEYRREQKAKGVAFIGEVLMDGESPTIFASVGDELTLTFAFVSPDTGLPVAGAPEIGRVDYSVNLDPRTPDVFVFVGSSSSMGSMFSLQFTVTEFEPEILAIPFLSDGTPIFIEGVDGNNVAPALVTALFLVPEPSTLVLLGLSFAALGALRRQR